MGLIYCKIHGQPGLLPVCEHLRQSMIENSRPDNVICVTYNFGKFFGDENCPMFMGFLYCRACIDKYKLPQESRTLPESETEAGP